MKRRTNSSLPTPRVARWASLEMDAFISHSSENRAIASQLESGLEAAGRRIWLDEADIHLGGLLRDELQGSIRRSRVLVLLWSTPASASRWIHSEWLMAYHLGKFIIPCTLDNEALPQCLQSSVFLKIKQLDQTAVDRLAKAVKDAPNSANRLAPVMRSAEAKLQETIGMITQGQKVVTDQLLKREIAKASETQGLLDNVMEHAVQVWPLDPVIVNLHGYHLKNAYLVKYWDAIQAGRGPSDELLDRAERRFFETLSIDPTEPSALNGLGSILLLERELDAAEFFIRTAIAAAAKRGIVPYEAAEHDLKVVLYYKGLQGQT